MEFLIEIVHGIAISMEEAILAIQKGSTLDFQFTEEEWKGITSSASELPNYSFLTEELCSKGIKMISIMDKEYSQTLKKNLGKDAPIILYAKGNIALLHQESVAIVGARKSNEKSLLFTDNIAKRAVENNFVVVSGFAKGVDKKALDSALHYKGKSIIVLPQGIKSYTSKEYYQELNKGNVLVISTYHPNTPWSVGLAMDRNKTIYGLAKIIYAAESNDSGGTWEGVLDGIKRKRTVYVRYPSPKEKNANLLLINKGAIAVDMNGDLYQSNTKELIQVEEPSSAYKSTKEEVEPSTDTILTQSEELIRNNKGKGLSIQDIVSKLSLDSPMKKKLVAILDKSVKLVKIKKGRSNLYYLKEHLDNQGKIF